MGAPLLASIVGTTAGDVVRHMYPLGVDVPPLPLLGSTCPMCGGRMPVSGNAAEHGICDACHQRLMTEARMVREAERRAYNEDRREWMRANRRDR